ncbi:MAG: LamG domain-containing protein [Bacteroidales bacterium]|nr:LamG domain-containing protein [Bacteroidales bacterium]
MKRFFVFAALAAFALTSCEQKIDIPAEIPTPGSSESTGLVFTATTESAATKTALSPDGENFNVVWQNDDQITIVDGATTPNVGVYSTESTTTTATFTLQSGNAAAEKPFKAWYPASIYNNGAPALPATQDYAEGNISGAPMFASSSTTSLNFKNLGGIICLNLSTSLPDISVASISLSATQPMSGPITNVEALSSDTPVAATVSGTAGVTLNCGAGVALSSTSKPFYIAVPAGTYSSLKITVATTDGKVQTRTSNKGIEVGRSQITNITLGFNNLLASSLVQYWPFDGNAKNAVSGGVDATVSGATLTTDRFGNESSAYFFDGNDKMTAPDAANFGQTSFTANIWVCSNQTSGLGNLMRTDGGYYKGWLLRFNAGRIEIWEGRTSNYAYVSTNSYADGSWHMVTYVRDVENRVGKLYVDGNYIGGYSMTGNINDVTNELRFGTYGNGEYYTGKMDDARLYNKALSQEEISEIYDS